MTVWTSTALCLLLTRYQDVNLQQEHKERNRINNIYIHLDTFENLLLLFSNVCHLEQLTMSEQVVGQCLPVGYLLVVDSFAIARSKPVSF